LGKPKKPERNNGMWLLVHAAAHNISDKIMNAIEKNKAGSDFSDEVACGNKVYVCLH
jgi:hypothetical protein